MSVIFLYRLSQDLPRSQVVLFLHDNHDLFEFMLCIKHLDLRSQSIPVALGGFLRACKWARQISLDGDNVVGNQSSDLLRSRQVIGWLPHSRIRGLMLRLLRHHSPTRYVEKLSEVARGNRYEVLYHSTKKSQSLPFARHCY